jgi:anti-sigma factor RsiW
MSSPSTGDNRAELLSAYLDAELDAEQSAKVESFLKEHPEADEELSQLREVIALVSNLPSVGAPDDFYENLAKKLRRKHKRTQQATVWGLLWTPFQVLSILVVLAIATLFLMNELDRPQAAEHEPLDEQLEASP